MTETILKSLIVTLKFNPSTRGTGHSEKLLLHEEKDGSEAYLCPYNRRKFKNVI